MPIYNNVLAGSGQGAAADLGDTIEQSLRFRGAQWLQRTFGSAGSQTTFTISVWLKKAVPTGAEAVSFLAAGTLGSGSSATRDQFDIEQPQYFRFFGSGQNISDSNQVKLRDPSAWYQVVISCDMSSTTSTDRIRVFYNGQRHASLDCPITSFNFFNTAVEHRIGTEGIGVFTEGYYADYYFIDGQALNPTDFGKPNKDGVWVPQDYTGNFGTNGFHLKFDPSGFNGSGGIGADHSGNGNHFTASGFDTTAISSSNPDNDVDFNDTPTSNYATLNPLFNAADHTPRYFGITKDANLAADTSGSEADLATTSNIELTDGKWYFEVTYTTRALVGIAGGNDRQNNRAFIEAETGNYTTQNSFGTSGPTSNSGSQTSGTIGCRVDITNRTLAFTWDGSTYTSNLTYSGPGHKIFPYISAGAGQPSNNTIQINHGQMPFIYTVPTGFEGALQTNNLPEPTIKNGKEHFGVLLYDGNGSTKTVNDTDAVDFTPDFVWIKARTGTRNHFAFDCIRGGSNGLLFNDTNSDVNRSTFLSSFDSGGFSVGADGDINANTVPTVAWCWKAGGEPTATNSAGAGNVPTAGSVKIDGDNKTDALAGANPATKISANTTAGFSIVQYEGTGSQTTVAHGLTQTPEFIIIHNRENNAFKSVYHEDSYVSPTDPGVLYMNRELARQTDTNVFGTSAMTLNNTVFTVGTYEGSNASAGDEHIAYVFHSVEGFSKFGSYTGNGDADGPFIYLGFRPAFVMVKRATVGTGNWQIMDTTRSTFNPADEWIEANEATAEQTGNAFISEDFLSNGFKPRGGASQQDNISGSVYVYMAFAENPFGGKNAPPATAR